MYMSTELVETLLNQATITYNGSEGNKKFTYVDGSYKNGTEILDTGSFGVVDNVVCEVEKN